jgi:hypothetical protein
MTTTPNLDSDKIILENFKTVDNSYKNDDFKKNGDIFKNFLTQAERNASARTKKPFEFNPLSPTPKLSNYKNSIKSPLKTLTTQATQANDNTVHNLPPKPVKINTISNYNI